MALTLYQIDHITAQIKELFKITFELQYSDYVLLMIYVILQDKKFAKSIHLNLVHLLLVVE